MIYVWTVIVGVVVAYILFLLVVGIAHMAKLFTWDLYHHWKYTTRGLCPGCHKPAALVSEPADQMYGGDQIWRVTCDCGATPFPIGNRHAAEW